MSVPPDITVAVVSYNTRDLLRLCLSSLEARQADGEATLEIVVADNASTDGSVEMVRAEFPGVRVLELGENAGFGRANNAALDGARGRFLCLVNSDAEVLPGAFRDALAYLNTHPKVGVVGGQLLWPGGREQPSWSRDPTPGSVLAEQLFLPPHPLPALPPAGGDVPQVCGAFMVIRADAWQEVGGFDSHYFMYNEDVDLNLRLRRAHWRVVFLPQVRITHHLGASSRADWQTRARMVSAYNASRVYYFARHSGPAAARRVRLYCLLGTALRLTGWWLIALFRPAARDKVKLFQEVWRQAWAMTDFQV